MAAIHEELILVDKFSGPLNKYMERLERVSETTTESQSAMDRLADAAEASSGRCSEATQELVENLSGLEAAMRSAYTDSEMEGYLAKLQQQMRRTGLVWTSEAAQMEASDLIVRVGLQRLAEAGDLAANSMAELAHQAKKAASAKAEEAAETDRAANEEKKHQSRLEKLKETLKEAGREVKELAKSGLQSLKNALGGVASKLAELGKQKSTNALSRQLTRFAVSIFSVSRILSAMTSALERAPQRIQTSWANAGSALNDLFAGTVVSALQELQPHIDNLVAALNSDAGQKLARGLETLAGAAGSAIGFLLDMTSQLITFVGDNFQTVMTVAAIVLGVFAAKMLLSAIATAAANAPLLLFIGLCAAVVMALQQMGIGATEIFGAIGSAAGWLYTLVYNLIADVWNVVAVFAEFFANVFNDPVAAVAHLFFDTFDAILGVVETVAGAIDALLGSDMAGAVSGFRTKMQNWVDDTFGEKKIKVERMEKKDYEDTMSKFSDAAKNLSESLSGFSLENKVGAPLQDVSDDVSGIAGDVSSIEKSVNMADEDLQQLIDMAERQYVNRINLTAQTPVVTVNGANTGNTQADRQALANTIRDILLEQAASGATRSTARAFSGG